MSCCRVLAVALLSIPAVASADYLAGGGIEADTADGIRLSALGSARLGSSTWLSGTMAKSTVELPTGRDSETTQGSLGIDHHFDPVGLRAGVGYWGDPDVLQSVDGNAALYFRNDRLTLAAEYKFGTSTSRFRKRTFFPEGR